MRRPVLLLLVLVLMLVPVAPAGAGAAVCSDAFDNDTADGWSVVSGDWSVMSGEYVQTDMYDNGGATPWGADMITNRCTAEDDYRIDADVRLLDVADYGGWWGLTFDYHDSANYELVALYTYTDYTRVEYWTYTYRPSYGRTVWLCVADAVVSSSSTAFPYQTHRLSVLVSGTDISVLLDDSLVLEATDTSGLVGGAVGLYTEEASAAFDNWSLTLPTAQDAIVALVDSVEALNLEKGISNSLDAKLANAVKALDDVNSNNDVAAVNKLEAFINEVYAQAGGKISVAEAEALIAQAEAIIAGLSG